MRVDKGKEGLKNMNNINMIHKAICIRCKVEDGLSTDEETRVLKVGWEFKKDKSTSDYLEILAYLRGNTCDNKRHIFAWNDKFNAEMDRLITLSDDIEGRLKAKELENDKVEDTISQLEKKLEEFKARRDEIPGEKDLIIMEKEEMLDEFKELTGDTDIKFWGELVEVEETG